MVAQYSGGHGIQEPVFRGFYSILYVYIYIQNETTKHDLFNDN